MKSEVQVKSLKMSLDENFSLSTVAGVPIRRLRQPAIGSHVVTHTPRQQSDDSYLIIEPPPWQKFIADVSLKAIGKRKNT